MLTQPDASGNPLSGVSVSAQSFDSSTATVSLYPNDPGEMPLQVNSSATTNSSGVADIDSLDGIQYGTTTTNGICANINSTKVCNSSSVTVNGTTYVTIQEVIQTPAAPTNLTAPSPTNQSPALTWTASSGATSYNIYRNDTKIGSSSTTSYTDNTATPGTYSYYVTAVNSGGESSASNTISVIYNTTPPAITYTVTPIADSNGNNTGNVKVTFTCTDNSGTGLASCTSPVTVGDEGIGQTVTGTAIDNAGNTTSINANASLLVTAISAGGSSSDPYVADTDYGGGTPYSSSASVDNNNVLNPAPQSVYQNCRYGNTFSYTFPGLTPNASYTLRLDFNELYWGAQGGGGIGSRVFNVAVNGTPALTNFDIYAAAGGSNKAIAEQIPTTADSNGNVTVSFTTDTDNAMVNGLALYNGTLPPLPPQPTVSSAYIAAGSNSTIGTFSADTDFSSGTPYSSTATVDTSGVTIPAPQAVYQHVRYGNTFSYMVPHLSPNTTYNVRLDFNELYWGTPLASNQGGAGSRVFNVAINGTQVLNNFDVYATAGGANKAIAENYTATSDAYGNIVISFTTDTDNAMVSGIEVTQ